MPSQRSAPLGPHQFPAGEGGEDQSRLWRKLITQVVQKLVLVQGQGRDMQVEEGWMGSWALAAREPHPFTCMIVIKNTCSLNR